MDTRQLSYFVQVAKDQSFTVAARHLHLSQPALSKMIKKLEEDLGVQLFDRSEHKMTLTDAGERLFEEGQKLLSDMEAITESILDTKNLRTGNVSVGIPPVIGTCYFPPLIANFRHDYPGINLSIIENGAVTVYEMVEKGFVDLGLVILPELSDRIEYIPVTEDEVVLVVHNDHPLASKDKVLFEDLKDESFALLDETFLLHHHVIKACREAGFEPNIYFKSSQWDFLTELVCLNQGISILPRPILARFNSQNIKQIPIEHPELKWRIAIILKKNRYVSFAAKKFIEFVKEHIK
ncbi:LysR family transcriptional regulator [Mesobacillus subterraneus]|uniref:LysR family transcriptional regulator n=1 Tax=Mesobacillus subterraneus TaxID=285983 RepID=UPI00203F3DF8|nr:LysR family transcriptional regulator [Mesobacillus subterraneus]MCM3664021.1 LysR family transcriptional regulator [Mesobacillus subterraneus]MCM3685513.1 LysR family transcriptional regulator [Mesobacillus subterraneus]